MFTWKNTTIHIMTIHGSMSPRMSVLTAKPMSAERRARRMKKPMTKPQVP